MYTVYLIGDKLNDVILYVGITNDFRKRKSQHLSSAFGNQTTRRLKIAEYMESLGRENIEFIEAFKAPTMVNAHKLEYDLCVALETPFNTSLSDPMASSKAHKRNSVWFDY